MWEAGQKQKAMDLLVDTDWNGDIRFSPQHYLFTMTESQCVSLVTGDKDKVMKEVLEQCLRYRALGRESLERSREVLASAEANRAQRYSTAAMGLGRLLNRSSDAMLIVRLLGISIQKQASTEQGGL